MITLAETHAKRLDVRISVDDDDYTFNIFYVY